MIETFGATYADAYDPLYADKDYAAECDLIERVFTRYAERPVGRVLDLGCGTGGHAVPLASRGYRVVGCDRSPDMLKRAAEKARKSPGAARTRFVRADLRDLDLEEQFDAALMMFAVLGYQISNDDVRAVLSSARRHLEPDGLLVFDIWYGPAVLAIGPGERVRVVDAGDRNWIRAAAGDLDLHNQVCTVRYRVWELAGDRIQSRTVETHRMRYFFPQEIVLLLDVCGFELLRFGAFPDIDVEPSTATWNALVVAKAKPSFRSLGENQ